MAQQHSINTFFWDTLYTDTRRWEANQCEWKLFPRVQTTSCSWARTPRRSLFQLCIGSDQTTFVKCNIYQDAEILSFYSLSAFYISNSSELHITPHFLAPTSNPDVKRPNQPTKRSAEKSGIWWNGRGVTSQHNMDVSMNEVQNRKGTKGRNPRKKLSFLLTLGSWLFSHCLVEGERQLFASLTRWWQFPRQEWSWYIGGTNLRPRI